MNPVLLKTAASLLRNRQGRPRPFLIGLLVLTMLAGLAMPVAVVSLLGYGVASLTGSSGSSPQVPACMVDAGLTVPDAGGMDRVNLDQTQLQHAGEVVRSGVHRRIPSYGVVIALAVALTESRLRMLANDGKGSDLRPEQRGVGASLEYPHDGVGTDHGSVNAFQQQWPYWGSMDELMSMDASTGKFYQALLKVPGWEELPLTVAAQRVQRSAYPNAYAPWEVTARALFAQLSGTADACQGPGDGMVCPATGFDAEIGMTPDALRVLRCAHQEFPQITDWIGNYLADGPSDHANGRAVDAMIPNWESPEGETFGWTVANWMRSHAANLGVKYVIFHDHIWSVLRDAEGWRDYHNREVPAPGDGTPSQRHTNHVHVSVFGNAAGQAGSAEAAVPVLGPYRLGATFSACGGRGTDCHPGQDFAVPEGTSVRAAAAGRVTFTAWGGPYGWLTKVSHGGGVQSWYAHQSRQLVHVGDKVVAGQTIGRSGSSGEGSGPHLHFEVRTTGDPTDPVVWLRAHGVDP